MSMTLAIALFNILLTILGGAYMFGKIVSSIRSNTKRVETLEEKTGDHGEFVDKNTHTLLCENAMLKITRTINDNTTVIVRAAVDDIKKSIRQAGSGALGG